MPSATLDDVRPAALDESSMEDWLRIVRGEFEESPGLHLTQRQAQRLWGLDAETCELVLGSLVDARFLRRTVGNQFARM